MHNYKPAPALLKDRVILVTGAGDGIGAAAAKAFAAHGATVVLLGRSARKLEKVYDDIERSGAPQPAIAPLNLEKAVPEQYLELATMLEKEFGRLDGLLHNAALLGTLTPLEQYDLKQWAQLMQVNLHAPYLLTRAMLSAAEKLEGRVGAVHQQRRWSQGPRLLGRLRHHQGRR